MTLHDSYKSLTILNSQLTQITNLFCLPWMSPVYILLLYTITILHDGALEASKHFLDKRSNKSISTSSLLQPIELVLKMNTFHFKGRYSSQKRGVAMGTKTGPSVACLFTGHLEELFFAQYEHYTPILYKRYIDDIIGATLCFEKRTTVFH